MEFVLVFNPLNRCSSAGVYAKMNTSNYGQTDKQKLAFCVTLSVSGDCFMLYVVLPREKATL